jgi:hypothetical protein
LEAAASAYSNTGTSLLSLIFFYPFFPTTCLISLLLGQRQVRQSRGRGTGSGAGDMSRGGVPYLATRGRGHDVRLPTYTARGKGRGVRLPTYTMRGKARDGRLGGATSASPSPRLPRLSPSPPTWEAPSSSSTSLPPSGASARESWRWLAAVRLRGSTTTRSRGSPWHTVRPTSTAAAQGDLEIRRWCFLEIHQR